MPQQYRIQMHQWLLCICVVACFLYTIIASAAWQSSELVLRAAQHYYLDSVVRPRNESKRSAGCGKDASPQATHVLESLSLRASVATRGNPVYFMLRAAHTLFYRDVAPAETNELFWCCNQEKLCYNARCSGG